MAAFRLASFALVFVLALPSLPELFQKSKQQFRTGAYAESLMTLETLDQQSRKPGAESERAALLPGLLFYRGASLAALGRSEEARAAFEAYLAEKPNTQVDPARYPRAVIAALEEAREAVWRRSGAPAPAEEASLAAAYRAFPAPSSRPTEDGGEAWAKGPVHALLTPEERRDFERRSDPVSRAEFIEGFWKARDPRPETPENEFLDEFARRVAFADARFGQDETRGSLTDRGTVFLLLGPPTYSGRKPIRTGDDIADASGLSQYGRAEINAAARAGGSSTARMARISRVEGPGAKVQEAASNWIEVWHYLRRNLPREVPNQELEFQFVTKVGYGKNVLLRESLVVTALERAKIVARRGQTLPRS